MKRIAILITCHNRKEKTINCLKSLFDCSIPANHCIRVFLVDDGSVDGTSDAVKELFPMVKVIKGNGELFWNRGMYLAWTTALTEGDFGFYVWLNDDVILNSYAISDLLKTSEKKPDSIIAGVLSNTKMNQATYGGCDKYGNVLIPNGRIQKCEGVIHGNFVLIPNCIVKKIGIIDQIFPHAIGDFDYSMRAKRNGFYSYIVSRYSGICNRNNSLPQWCLVDIPLLKRIEVLYSPLGYAHPAYFFIYERRHFGLATAIKHFLSIHIRVLLPSLWAS